MDRCGIRDVTQAGPCLWMGGAGCDAPTAPGHVANLGGHGHNTQKDPLMGWVAAPTLPGLNGGCLQWRKC